MKAPDIISTSSIDNTGKCNNGQGTDTLLEGEKNW